MKTGLILGQENLRELWLENVKWILFYLF